jgi:integrase
MKIKKTVNHGKIRWRVNDPHGTDGKRQRKLFETKEAAERYARQKNADREAFGIHFATIPPSERAALAYQLQRLRALGWSLAAAVDFVERHGKAPPSIRLGKLSEEFFAARLAAGVRPRYLRTLRASINRFSINRREKVISEITPAEIQEYISRNGWAPSTMRSYLVDVRTFFAFAVKRKYLPENPALAVDLPRLDEKSPGIVTPDQAKRLLNACLDAAPDILPVVALSLFGGIRRAEAERIEWAEIGAEFIEIKAEKAKTRRRRLVPISAQLRAWLDCSRAIGGKLPAVNYADKFKRALEKSKLRAEWPQNGLRHSFASYHYAKHRNENETAALMGNSPQMVFAHYRELVRPAEAEAFFEMIPPSDALARAKAARAALHRRIVPPRAVKITAEAVAAAFDGGRLELPRREAVAALRARCGCSVCGAYAALSPKGRFHSHLRELEGVLSWQPFPLVSAERENRFIPFPATPKPENLLALKS